MLQFSVGLHSEVIGSNPTLLWIPSKVVVFGFDCEVVGVRIDKGEICFRITFDTPFHSFLLLDEQQILLVFTEIGVIALEYTGCEVWRYEKDIINDCIIQSDILTLLFLDSPSMKIDLLTGKIVD